MKINTTTSEIAKSLTVFLNNNELKSLANDIIANISEDTRKDAIPTVWGVGYSTKGKFPISVDGVQTDAYKKWSRMLQRTSSNEYKENNPAYRNCTVVDEWLDFQVFAEWYDQQYKEEGWHLDKDMIIMGNKQYGPETCAMVPVNINCLFNSKRNRVGMLPVGVTLIEGSKLNPYKSTISIGGKVTYLGVYSTAESASRAYIDAKLNRIYEEAIGTPNLDPRVKTSLLNMGPSDL